MSHPTPNPADAGLATIHEAPRATLGCCGLAKLVTPALITMTVLAISLAAYFAGRSSGDRERMEAMDWKNFPPIHATASVSSEKFSIATGTVSEEAEGLFVLDHNSGLLQCNVIYPRVGKFWGQFTTNVAEAMGTGGKGGKYIMVTGVTNFQSNSANPAGNCVLYVMDASTGNYAAYGVPFNQATMNAKRQQQGALVLLYQGTANPLIDRDNLR